MVARWLAAVGGFVVGAVVVFGLLVMVYGPPWLTRPAWAGAGIWT